MILNNNIQCAKSSANARANIVFFLVCLAFIAGVLIFRICSRNIFYAVESIAQNAAIGIMLSGCVFLLVLMNFASLSCAGTVLVPLYSLLCGYLMSAFAGFIIPAFSDQTPLIIPIVLFASAYIFVFAFLFAAQRAASSSALLIKRLLCDKRLRLRLSKTLLCVLTVALLISLLFVFLSKYIFDFYF